MRTSSFMGIAGAARQPSPWHVNWKKVASQCSSSSKWIAFPGFIINDVFIPANVAQAANFHQSNGLVHGLAVIRAADPARTKIIGKFRFDYKTSPYTCNECPWYDRVFVKPHTQIECDSNVWKQAESLIRAVLPPKTSNSSTP
jgi:hypothetical protein